MNVPAVPTVKVAALALVIVVASSTVKVNVWVASGAVVLWAVTVSEYDPPDPAAGVPARVAVPSPVVDR